MKSIFFTYLCFLCSFSVVHSQSTDDFVNVQDWKFSLSGGVEFAAGKGFSGNTFFIMPTLSKPVSPKFTLHTGTLFQSFTFFPSEKNGHGFFFPLRSFSVFGAGELKISEKFTLYGGLIHSEPLSGISEKQLFRSGNAFFGGVDYSISKDTKIGVRFLYGSDYFPLYSYPAAFRNDQSGYLFPFNRK